MATLVYVDDEQTIGVAISRWFGRRGHTVHLATTISAAQKVLATESPDLLFLDVWLGEESGFELMSWIEDTRPELAERVTFVTGDLESPDRADKVFRTLGRPVLRKPFDFAQLEEIIGEADRQPGRDADRPPPGAEPRAGA